MTRKKRPYFSLIVFATLLIFALFLAWQSSVFSKQMEEARDRQAGGRTLYLPLAGDLPCTGRGCPGSPYPAPAYPALDNPSPRDGALENPAWRADRPILTGEKAPDARTPGRAGAKGS